MPAVATPVTLTSFVGREHEVASVTQLLDRARLVTLTGAGGSGKTRLASEVAAQRAAAFRDGVAWVELAPIQDAELVPNQVLTALGAEQGARAPMAALVAALSGKSMLLVLDNCEHLVEAAAALVDQLLRDCPGLRVLATSREALGVDGERAWLVPGLGVPPSGSPAALSELEQSEAVRLFVDRAQSALATFRLTPQNGAAVAQICRRLDGLPLAIELAAARVRTLAPEQLAERLDDTFRLLTSRSRTAVPRHRTLRGAMDWSYELLDGRERLLLQRLSTFAGEFALEQAEAVCADRDLPRDDVLDVLAALVDKSLVVMRETRDGSSARYHLLETVRQYGAEKLTESGAQRLIRERHAQTYAALVANAAPWFITRDRPRWVAAVHDEIDNVRLALAWTRDEDAGQHLQLLGDLGWFWYSSGLWSEGRRLYTDALARSGAGAPAFRAAALLGGGVLASLQADSAVALRWLEESAAIAQSLGDRSGEAYALAYLGVAHGQSGNDAARAPLERALAWFREANDLYGLRLSLVVLSTFHLVRGDLERARREAEEGVQVAREFGLDRELAIALQIHATVLLVVNDAARAAELFRESLGALQRDPSLFWIARGLHLFGITLCRVGQPTRGLRYLAAAEACRESMGAQLLPHDRARQEPVLDDARRTLGAEVYDEAWRLGRACAVQDMLDQAVAEPLPGASTEAVAEPSAPAAAFPATLDVHALGPLEIRRDGALLPDDAWRYTRPRELLLYLLSHPDGRTRDQIGLTFWPDVSATQVKNNFHVALHHVRKAIGRSDLIRFEHDRYRVAWELGIRFDARLFEESMAPAVAAVRAKHRPADAVAALADIRRALALYRGDFLESEGAGDWHLDVRDRLRRLYSDGLLLLAEQLMLGSEYAEAAEMYRRVVAIEEVHEEAHRRLMLALSRSGDRSAALRQYERLAQLLKTDLQAEPEAATKALYDRLKRAEAV